MKLNMSFLIKGLAGIAICSAIMIATSEPAQAILEGSNRDRLEYLNYSETMIKDGLYAKTGKATFNRDKKRYVRGIKRHNEPRIYQPDVYTWELAMDEHKNKMQAMAPIPSIPTSNLAPTPMDAEKLMPYNPTPNVIRNHKTGRKAEDIKRRIVQHMDSLDSRYPYNIPALQPAVYPSGRRGDSFDANY